MANLNTLLGDFLIQSLWMNTLDDIDMNRPWIFPRMVFQSPPANPHPIIYGKCSSREKKLLRSFRLSKILSQES